MYKSSQTGLCDKVWTKVRNVGLELFHTQVKLSVFLDMQLDALEDPLFWP